MSTQLPEPPDESIHRDRREHAGAPAHPDDDALARRTEEERVDAGVVDYDPADVPPATDVEPDEQPAETAESRAVETEVRVELDEGELRPIDEQHPFPPTRYDRE